MDNKETIYSILAELKHGAWCANCQNKDNMCLIPLYNNANTPAIALIFLCGICRRAALERTLQANLAMQFVGI